MELQHDPWLAETENRKIRLLLELGVLSCESDEMTTFVVLSAFDSIARHAAVDALKNSTPWTDYFDWVRNMNKAEREALAQKIREACPQAQRAEA